MKPIVSLFLSLLPLSLFAQKNDYPQDYFRNPLDIPIFLAGNFGECRPGHFHSGVDIKTLGEENQPVHAAADGYISRIKMEKSGFGHALYVTHPNGYTTLYAHLNNFAPAIQKYLKDAQYEKKRWDVDLQLSPGQFPVKKGQQIAWSGNTGGSTAPHLHFEIRNTKTEHPLNPELFGLPITDKLPPEPTEAVVYLQNGDGDESIYGCDKVSAALVKKNGVYKLSGKDTMVAPERPFGIGINADDYMDGSDNTLAFYTASLYVDDVLQTKVTLDDIGYDETRYVNAYADYKTHQTAHKWIQCLFELPGNRLDHIYTFANAARGRLNLPGNSTHKISIDITDDKENKSTIVFYLRAPAINPGSTQQRRETRFYANKPNSFSNSNVNFTLDERQLYDDIWFRFGSTADNSLYSDKYELHLPSVPLHHYFDLNIKANQQISSNLNGKVAMMYSDGKTEEGRAAMATGDGWYKAAVRSFGTYWLDIDTIPPVIRSLQKNGSILSKAKQITFDVTDDMTSVKTYSGYLDGKWICFEQHGNLFFYKFDEHCSKGRHTLIFKAEDENGNPRSYKLAFTR
jgi:hypothetical protein